MDPELERTLTKTFPVPTDHGTMNSVVVTNTLVNGNQSLDTSGQGAAVIVQDESAQVSTANTESEPQSVSPVITETTDPLVSVHVIKQKSKQLQAKKVSA